MLPRGISSTTITSQSRLPGTASCTCSNRWLPFHKSDLVLEPQLKLHLGRRLGGRRALESYEHKAAAVGPHQAEDVYHKKGKCTVEVTCCHSLEDTDGAGGCTAGCATFSKMIHVKP